MISMKANLADKVRTSDIPLYGAEEVGLANDTIESQADELRKLGETVHTANGRTRIIIYEALSGAARFWVANAFRCNELQSLYRNNGIRPPREGAAAHLQLLPIIKLMLGLDDLRGSVRNEADDRARRSLQRQASDYAMALAFALSEEPDPSCIVNFFSQRTLGVVEAASRYRKTREKDRTTRQAANPLAAFEGKPSIATFDLGALPISSDGPVALIVERANGAWVVRAAIDELTAIRRLSSLVQKALRLETRKEYAK